MERWFFRGLLLLAAFIWGTTFVAQKIGTEFLQPFYYNGFRFGLGLIVLMVFYYLFGKKANLFARITLTRGLISGLFLFSGASLQQLGINYTTSGKAGFITGLYVVLVPFLGIFLGKKASKAMWVGCGLTFWGLYLLAFAKGDGTVNWGDFCVFLSAIFFTLHMVSIDLFLDKVDPLELCLVQYAFCTVLSLALALALEPVTLVAVRGCFWAIFYGGVLSVGVAYTLQIIGQKKVDPTPAALILSLEAVFAAVGGYFVLGETITLREQIGCVFMLTGIVVSQIKVKIKV